MPDTVIEEIVIRTNIKIAELRQRVGDNNRGKFTYSDTTVLEFRAFIGCLIMAGIRRDNHMSTASMFSPTYGCQFYRCIFSEKRFAFLIRSVRFDDQATRRQRMRTDRFAHIRYVWEEVIKNCRENYHPGPVVTVDEQLLAFRGRCVFRVYIANKPAKYGIKIFMACDADSLYCLNAIPYLGKGSVPPLNPSVNQGQWITTKLVEPFRADGRVICCDNWFTSLNLAKKLLADKMHLVGTIRPKPYLPTNEIIKEKLKVGESCAIFQRANKVNVVYKKVKTTKHVAVMTTVHNSFSTVEDEKTEAHMYYNASKGGVDAFDRMCAESSTSRKTRRWPLCVFYGLINIATNNSWIIYASSDLDQRSTRSDYTHDLAYHLARPWALHRYRDNGRYFSRFLRDSMKTVFNIEEEVPEMPGRILSENRKRCTFCTRNTWSGKTVCNGERCGKNVCNDHSVILCPNCWQRQ